MKYPALKFINGVSILSFVLATILLSSCKDNESNENVKSKVKEVEKIEQKIEQKIEPKIESYFGDYISLPIADVEAGKYIIYKPASDGFLIVDNDRKHSTYRIGISRTIGVNPDLNESPDSWDGETNTKKFTLRNSTSENTSDHGTIPINKGHRFVISGDRFSYVTWIGIGAKANEVSKVGLHSYR